MKERNKYMRIELLAEDLRTCWEAVPRHWKKAFVAALAVNFFVFFYGMSQYPLGDHDVGFLARVPETYHVSIGRWFAPFLYSLSGFLQIPVYTQTLAIIFQITAGMGAVLLWKKEAGFGCLFFGGLLVSLCPFVNEHYYYHWMAADFPFSQLCMVFALLVADRKRGVPRLLASSLLVMMGLATYQSSLMAFTVVWCGLCVFKLADCDASPEGYRRLAVECGFTLLPLFLGVAAYQLSLVGLVQIGMLKADAYQLQAAASPLTDRLWKTVASSFGHLWFSQPYFPRIPKIVLLIVVCTGAACLAAKTLRPTRRNAIFRLVALLVMLVGVIIASKSQVLVSDYSNYYAFRFSGAGLSYLYLAFLTALLASPVAGWRRVGIVCALAIVPMFAVNDLRAQEQIVHSNRHDFAVLNRVVARIESLDEFDPDKSYNIVQFGRTKPYIPELYRKNAYDVGGVEFFSITVSQDWWPGFELNILSRYLKLGEIRINGYNTAHKPFLAKAALAARGHRAFPHKDSCFIMDGDTLVLVFDEQALEYTFKRKDIDWE